MPSKIPVVLTNECGAQNVGLSNIFRAYKPLLLQGLFMTHKGSLYQRSSIYYFCLFSSRILCLQKTPVASLLFCTYVEKHPGIKRRAQPYKQPLLNFIAFLLLAVEM